MGDDGEAAPLLAPDHRRDTRGAILGHGVWKAVRVDVGLAGCQPHGELEVRIAEGAA